MRAATFRDLANRQHGKSKATQPGSVTLGGWLYPQWCERCCVPLTETDREANRCTQCGTIHKIR